MEESRVGSLAQSQETSMFATEDEENALSETRVSGNVAGKTIILIHDVIDTGRLLKTAVEVSECTCISLTTSLYKGFSLKYIFCLYPAFNF